MNGEPHPETDESIGFIKGPILHIVITGDPSLPQQKYTILHLNLACETLTTLSLIIIW